MKFIKKSIQSDFKWILVQNVSNHQTLEECTLSIHINIQYLFIHMISFFQNKHVQPDITNDITEKLWPRECLNKNI